MKEGGRERRAPRPPSFYCLLLTAYRLLFPYGSASTMTRKRKVPVAWTPSLKLTLTDLPACSGVPKVTESVEFSPPPFGCAGGASKVVASTLTLQGVVATPLEARHVPASLTGPTADSLGLVRARD